MGFPGLTLTNTSVKLALQNHNCHFDAIKSLADTYAPDLVFPMMDLTIEANALGRYTIFPLDEPASVAKTPFSFQEMDRLKSIDMASDCRVLSFLKTVELLDTNLPKNIMRGAYVIGPFTLAGLIMGADDAAMATVMDTDNLKALLQLCLEKIMDYIELLVAAGAELICILEPSGMMLSPDFFQEFSADYVKNIVTQCDKKQVDSIYHVCGNSMHLVSGMINSGVTGLSLDAEAMGIDLEKVMTDTPENTVIIGNINPIGNIRTNTAESVHAEVTDLLEKMAAYPNFVLSTGCDLPIETPHENIQAFMEAGRNFQK
ncbi:uroporphyrinogen decarboxylase family protein [bacterium]|nr:uroporphyrinogen decarboxylase family protein [bacterium]